MATKKTEVIEIKPLDIKKVQLRIVGDTPLIMHAWSIKEKRMMLEAQQGKKKGKEKPKKNPVNDFIQSMYWLDKMPDTEGMNEEECEKAFIEAINNGARFGFPVSGLKQAAISAAYRLGWSKDKASLRGAFFIESDKNCMIEIKSDVPVIREDMVRIGMGTADIRYRGQFNNWYADITISYNANGQHDLAAIVNMLNAGGYVCGLGEWRVEKDGNFGMFHVEAI